MGFFGGDRGDLGPPPDPFRLPRGGDHFRTTNGQRRVLGLAAAILVLFFIADALKSIYVDSLWFGSVGFEGVFRTEITARAVLFVVGTVVSAAFLGGNVWLARRLAPREPEESFIEDIDPAAIRRVMTVLAIAVTAFVALIFGDSASGAWDTMLTALKGVRFGLADPQFGRDVSFYLFTLPASHLVQSWILALLVISTLAAAAVYVLAYSLQRFVLTVTRGMRIHLSILVALALLAIAAGVWLSVFDLASQESSIVAGVTYVDVHARIPMLYVLALLTVLVSGAIAINGFIGTSFRVPVFGLGLMAFTAIVGTGLYPAAVDSFQVQPNELQTQSQYIARNIKMTRIAYGLDHVEETNFPARPELTPQQIDSNPVTIQNVRLWDPNPLRDTFNQIQSIRPFYTFADVDVDRYNINGQAQQMMLAVRELDVSRAGAANWTRQVLQLTHGFGAVASPVNNTQNEGLPVLLLSDIPPTGTSIPLPVDGARVYFGERTDHYVVVHTNVPEFDYPLGDGTQNTSYQPDRGIRLSSAFRRLALAWELGDTNLLISGQLGADSRVLMHRTISDRIHMVAPFLQLDSDPYAVILNGQIEWVQDAYTTSSQFPYSQHRNGINYMRNSVKVLMDATTGDMTFYEMTPDDPVVATWSKVFPGLFTPASQMPAGLVQHLRYPEGLFKLQADIYQRYHITDPSAFFVAEDQWNIPAQPAQQSSAPIDPYYVTMKLPGEANEEFVLVMPFTPRNRDNTVAWLAAESDGQFYGTLRAYRFPTDTLVFGPTQIEARIDQHPGISQQMTLWNQSGSHVIRGNLLMIPIDDSFLFVEPIYLQAENSPLPELKRVIVANGNAIAMEPTFADALDVVLGRKASTLPGEAGGGVQLPTPTASPTGNASPIPRGTVAPSVTPRGTVGPATSPTGTPSTQDLRSLIDQARQASNNAQQELDRLRSLLDQIESQSSR